MLLLRKLYRLSDRRQRLLFAWLAFLFLVTAALDAIGLSLIFPLVLAIDEPVTLRQSGFARPFLDLLGVEDETAVVVTFGLSLVAVFLIKNVLLGIIWRYAFSQINLEAAKTASRLVKAHLESPFLVQVQEKNSELIRNVANEVHQMFTGVIRPMLDLVRELSLSAGLLVALLLVQIIREENPFVTLAVVFIVALASTAMMIVLNRLLTTLGTERTERFAGMIGWLNDVWHSPREIKIYGVGKYFSDGFEKDATRYSYTLSRNQFYAQLPRLSLEFVGITAIVVLILGIALGGSALANALPTLALIFIILIRLMPSTSQIVSAFTAIRFSAPAVEIIYDKLISSRNDGRFLSPHQPLDVDKNFHRVIEVQNVSFTYPGSLRSALNGINLKITAGEKIGIVGASGSGKTTLLHLILGLNYPTEGKILIDGIDIRECREQWQRDIGILPQEIYLRDSTIRENVALGIPDWDVDGARVKKSLTEANLWEFVKSLPLGIETQVGDRGAKLSGGQRQRLGLARALYRDPHVLVLDEPTAALDEQTESMVLTSIFDVAKDRTAIIVTHKPYLMDHCDTVITVVDGRISTYESSRDYRVQSDMLERPINT